MEAVARAARDPLVGPLKLGVIPTLAPYLMPLILKPLRQAYPGLTIELWEDQTRALIDGCAITGSMRLCWPLQPTRRRSPKSRCLMSRCSLPCPSTTAWRSQIRA